MSKTKKLSGMLLHRGIPYHYKEWTTWNGKQASGYGCEHFNFAPYNVSYLPAQTEAEMKARIDDKIDNIDRYADYKSVTSGIEDLDIVRSVDLSSVTLGKLELVLETNVSVKFLRRDLNGLAFLSERTDISSNESSIAFDWIN